MSPLEHVTAKAGLDKSLGLKPTAATQAILPQILALTHTLKFKVLFNNPVYQSSPQSSPQSCPSIQSTILSINPVHQQSNPVRNPVHQSSSQSSPCSNPVHNLVQHPVHNPVHAANLVHNPVHAAIQFTIQSSNPVQPSDTI